MTWSITNLILGALIGTWWRWPAYRRQMVWGVMFALPYIAIEAALSGSWERWGVSIGDRLQLVSSLTVAVLASSAILAAAYEGLINRWLTPQVHPARRLLWYVLSGPASVLVMLLLGVHVPIALATGGFISAVTLLIVNYRLVWDAMAAGLGMAVWYGCLGLLYGPRTSGDELHLVFDGRALGITVSGISLEHLLAVVGLGWLLGPLFAAVKQRRRPNHKLGSTTPVKMVLVTTAVLGLLAGAVWVTQEFILPSTVTVVQPSHTDRPYSAGGTIELMFSRPVERSAVQLTSTPEIPGSWKFSAPAFGRHGFRQATFTPDVTLLPGVSYAVRIDGLASSWGLTAQPIELTWTTPIVPDVESIVSIGPDGSAISDATRPTIQPCSAITVDLTSPSDASSEFTFSLTPGIPVVTTLALDRQTYTVHPANCLQANHSYLFRARRQTVVRDPVTSEIVAATEAETVFETALWVGPDPVPAGTAGLPPAQVLGVTASSVDVLQPVRRQKILNVRLDYQDRALSCEAAALKMALAAQRVSVSETAIMKRVGFDPTPRRNGVWGDPNRAFVGNINGRQNTTGYGVHWAPIALAGQHWRKTTVITNGKLTDLTEALNAGHAVVVWGTMGRAYRDQWKTPEGTTIRAWKGEHARTLIGYIGTPEKPTRFILNDPVNGRLTWTAATMSANWATFNNSAVVVQ
jgi:uncharacterized protein YvpB